MNGQGQIPYRKMEDELFGEVEKKGLGEFEV